MGKLDDIIARNKNPKRFGERMTVGIGLGLFVILILVMMVCTDLGKHPEDTGPAPSSINPTDKRVDDVRLVPMKRTGSGSSTGSASGSSTPR